MKHKTLTAPTGLSSEAKHLWKTTLEEYEFGQGTDMTLLGELCRALDRLRQIQKEITSIGLTIEGSQGQMRPNPLLQSEDQVRRTILAHVRALRLNSLEF